MNARDSGSLSVLPVGASAAVDFKM